VVGGGGVGTIRMKKETCIYLILPKNVFWEDSGVYLVEVIRLTILPKITVFEKANKILIKINNLGNI